MLSPTNNAVAAAVSCGTTHSPGARPAPLREEALAIVDPETRGQLAVNAEPVVLVKPRPHIGVPLHEGNHDPMRFPSSLGVSR